MTLDQDSGGRAFSVKVFLAVRRAFFTGAIPSDIRGVARGFDEARRLCTETFLGSTDANDSQDDAEGEEDETFSVSLIEQDVPPHWRLQEIFLSKAKQPGSSWSSTHRDCLDFFVFCFVGKAESVDSMMLVKPMFFQH